MTAQDTQSLDVLTATLIMGCDQRTAECVPAFSTNLIAAWDVVEAMRVKGFQFLLMSSARSGIYIASFYVGPHDRTDNSRSNYEAPAAICRAALAAWKARQ